MKTRSDILLTTLLAVLCASCATASDKTSDDESAAQSAVPHLCEAHPKACKDKITPMPSPLEDVPIVCCSTDYGSCWGVATVSDCPTDVWGHCPNAYQWVDAQGKPQVDCYFD